MRTTQTLEWESGQYYEAMATFDCFASWYSCKNARTQLVLECPLPFQDFPLQGGTFDPKSLGVRGKCGALSSVPGPENVASIDQV